MGRGQRIALLLAAVAVGAVGVLLVARSDEDDDSPRPVTTRTEAQERRPDRGPTATVRVPTPRFETIRILDGEVRGGARRITVAKGETALIEVRSDTPDEVHLHGYDVFEDVTPGRPARFQVEANLEGEFELEAHDVGHLVVGTLVVEP